MSDYFYSFQFSVVDGAKTFGMHWYFMSKKILENLSNEENQ